METNRNSQLSATDSNGRFLMPPQPAPTVENDEETFDLGRLGSVVRRRIGLVSSVALGTIAVGTGLLFFMDETTPAQYAGKFQILVEPVTAEDKLAKLSTQAQGGETQAGPQQIDVEQSSLDYETQILVLQSRKLMDPVIKEIQKKYPHITYDFLLGSGKLSVSRVSSMVNRTRQETKMIEVWYQDSDPEQVQFVLDKISQAYLKYSLNERQSNIRQGVKFIDDQLPQLRRRVDNLQREVQDLRQQNTLVDPELQGQQLTTRAGTLEQQRIDSQTQLSEIQAKQSTLQGQSQSQNLPSVLGEAPYYQSLLNQYQELEGKIAIESARLEPDNPQMQALLEKRQNLQALMRQEANRVLSKANDQAAVAQARNQAITQSETEINQEIRRLPLVARQYADLQRELTVATDSLSKFLARREALEIDAAQKEVPWELTMPPDLNRDVLGQPMNVGKISKVQFLVLTVILGLLIGVGVGLLVETSQNTLQTTDEAKRTAKLPVLGTIPLKGVKMSTGGSFFSKLPFQRRSSGSGIVPVTPDEAGPEFSGASYDSAPFSESFRSLYKNIRLLRGLPTAVRSLTICSAEPGDGKSTISVNLALAAAAMGKRVLLVDADLRHPQVHQLLGLSNEFGLSDIITSNVSIRNALQPMPNRENLMVLTAGRTVIEPAEVLSSHRMQALMDRFLVAFDLVIYDTPPLLGLADSSLVAAQTNGVALVVRLGKTKRSSLVQALEDLKLSSTNILGMVVNGSKDTVTLDGYHYRYEESPQNGVAPVRMRL